MSTAIELTSDVLRRMPLADPKGKTDKEARGRVLIAGGSTSSPGAVMLSGLAALRAGAGKVQLAVPQSLVIPLGISFVEAGVAGFAETAGGEPALGACRQVCEIARLAEVVLIGPGIMSEEGARALAEGLLRDVVGPLFIIDAMALTDLWEASDLLAPHQGRVILTPHAGEMAALCGFSKDRITADPIRIARDAAQRLGCTVVLKGAHTCITQADGPVYSHRLDNPGLATAGSGDVLAGIIAGLAARGSSPLAASAWGVFVHAQAGAHLAARIGKLGFLARELLEEVPALVAA